VGVVENAGPVNELFYCTPAMAAAQKLAITQEISRTSCKENSCIQALSMRVIKCSI